MRKHILVINGNPKPDSFCRSLAESYARGASERGHHVETVHLAELRFDPSLWHGYDQRQELEPDLLALKQQILAAQHLVFAYPIWWGGMPSLMKGMFDRLFLPGIAFRYHDGSNTRWERLLAGRSAQLLVSMDTPPWYFRWIYRMPGIHQMRRTILEFCGVKPVRVATFGAIRGADDQRLKRWLHDAQMLGARA
ncbi:NAD(P)H-dependent oxidoreductase [Montanilutibacter psychrotolerans]|uniref:Flavodoxin family protein n=1 Tax=Montanilutibacter psychrotolerans TaxID=1327343 RepID=A0A3M8SR66_9GAMM|nr:NAD(P)H-dependent oxidoreductase [Lysobacter psychrotolerans]RNF83263.1 flavodoxin family protein [Lysobacter psychrotolerans]